MIRVDLSQVRSSRTGRDEELEARDTGLLQGVTRSLHTLCTQVSLSPSMLPLLRRQLFCLPPYSLRLRKNVESMRWGNIRGNCINLNVTRIERFAGFSSRSTCRRDSQPNSWEHLFSVRARDFWKTGYKPRYSDVIRPKSKINFR